MIKSFTHAIISLRANKIRSFLTMLGIIIGIAAVIIIMSVGAGAQNLILSQIKTLGSDLITILPGGSEEMGPPAAAMGIVITTLTYDDAKAIKKEVSGLVDVAGYNRGFATLSWQSNKYDTSLNGVTSSYRAVEGGELEQGRFFTQEEEKNLSKVIVLGYAAKQELFGEQDAIGKRVKIKKNIFKVIGVMRERGTVAFQDYDDQVLVPIKTMQKLILGIDHLAVIRIKVQDVKNMDSIVDEIKMLLRDRHEIYDQSGTSDDFTIRNTADALDMLGTITDALRYFLAAMAALSLVVGGIGIMNIMLVSVFERTQEIGLRKAIGANNFNILSQFLAEAVSVTLIGGIFGIILGILFSFVIYLIANYLEYDWELIISPMSIILSVFVATLVGLIFGIYPAQKASKLDPIDALRFE